MVLIQNWVLYCFWLHLQGVVTCIICAILMAVTGLGDPVHVQVYCGNGRGSPCYSAYILQKRHKVTVDFCLRHKVTMEFC